MDKNGLNGTTLLLFTEMFPFGINSEQAFLTNEIIHLTNAFKKVIVFPQFAVGEQTTTGQFQVDVSLAEFLHKRSKLTMLVIALKQSLLFSEFLSKNIFFWNIHRLKRLLYYTARQALVTEWCKTFIRAERNYKSAQLLVYTYWNNEITTGLLGCKPQFQNARFISRAHGHDLYEDYWDYLPFQKYNLTKLDRLFVVSKQAKQYMNRKYPDLEDKVVVSHLGVKAAKKPAERSNDGILRIVSCSYVIKLKRIELIIVSLAEYALKYRQKLEWTHFGDGEQMGRIKILAESKKNDWFIYSLKGFVNNSDVLNFYESNPVDIFIHLSESEGGVPVAIQEALAYGIPLVATNVGGIAEIVTSETGILVSSNPGINEVTEAIYQLDKKKQKSNLSPIKSVLHWQKNFDEKRNFDIFLTELDSLLNV